MNWSKNGTVAQRAIPAVASPAPSEDHIRPETWAISAAGLAEHMHRPTTAMLDMYGDWVGVITGVILPAARCMELHRHKVSAHHGHGVSWGAELPDLYDVWEELGNHLMEELSRRGPVNVDDVVILFLEENYPAEG